jgi:hypothetical protein
MRAPAWPFGGVGASGYGRETAAETLYEYGYSKNIRLVSGRGEIPRALPRGDRARQVNNHRVFDTV